MMFKKRMLRYDFGIWKTVDLFRGIKTEKKPLQIYVWICRCVVFFCKKPSKTEEYMYTISLRVCSVLMSVSDLGRDLPLN